VVRRVTFAVPGDLATPTGGYAYDRRIIAELRATGWSVDVLDIGTGFPRPSDDTRTQARQLLDAVPPGQPIVVDGLAYGVMAEEAKSFCQNHPVVALVHHPLALESGLSPADAEAFRASERSALACAHLVVTTSPMTARLVRDEFGVAADRLMVVQPGTDRVTPERGAISGTIMLLAVGAVVPRKGYDVLLAAVAQLKGPWRLIVVGDRTRSPDTVRLLDDAVVELKLTGRVDFVGAVPAEELAGFYTSANLFVLPSRFEGYGLAFTEAIAYGVPVVATNAGAIPDTVPQGAGILVPPDDAEALAKVLQRLIECPHELEKLAAGARAAAQSFPSWRDSATLFAQALDRVVEGKR
jgi:glycosyltransferase involved in cell wall biosynthesis